MREINWFCKQCGDEGWNDKWPSLGPINSTTYQDPVYLVNCPQHRIKTISKEGLHYYINNPSAWGSFSQEGSDLLEAALSLVPESHASKG